jgi:hypothetical protein
MHTPSTNQSNSTRSPPISSLYLDDWPSYDGSNNNSNNNSNSSSNLQYTLRHKSMVINNGARVIPPSSEYPPCYSHGSFRPVSQDVFLPRITPTAMSNRTGRPDTFNHAHDPASTREPTKLVPSNHFDSARNPPEPPSTQQPPSHPEQIRDIISHVSPMHY